MVALVCCQCAFPCNFFVEFWKVSEFVRLRFAQLVHLLRASLLLPQFQLWPRGLAGEPKTEHVAAESNTVIVVLLLYAVPQKQSRESIGI